MEAWASHKSLKPKTPEPLCDSDNGPSVDLAADPAAGRNVEVGWTETGSGGRKRRYRGRERNRAWFKMTVAVYSLIRITNLDNAVA